MPGIHQTPSWYVHARATFGIDNICLGEDMNEIAMNTIELIFFKVTYFWTDNKKKEKPVSLPTPVVSTPKERVIEAY